MITWLEALISSHVLNTRSFKSRSWSSERSVVLTTSKGDRTEKNFKLTIVQVKYQIQKNVEYTVTLINMGSKYLQVTHASIRLCVYWPCQKDLSTSLCLGAIKKLRPSHGEHFACDDWPLTLWPLNVIFLLDKPTLVDFNESLVLDRVLPVFSGPIRRA